MPSGVRPRSPRPNMVQPKSPGTPTHGWIAVSLSPNSCSSMGRGRQSFRLQPLPLPGRISRMRPTVSDPRDLECGAIGPVLKHGPRSYTLPRVEGARSSAKEALLAPDAQRKQVSLDTTREGVRAPAARPSGPGPRALGARAVERQSVYPRGGDLSKTRMKPRETLVEVRRGIDVQIIPQSFGLGRKTHRTTS